jgi:hypothetical protein
LLTRADDLLFLADVVIADDEARIEYSSRLPLAPDVTATADTRTRSCSLATKSGSARAFPLGLPCERIAGAAGRFAASNGLLELRHSARGGLFAPIVVDWNPDRLRSTAVWRPLTVAQNGVILPARSAAGYRLQIGAAQWLVYRSLSRIPEPRTVLGHHTLYETVIGRFAHGSVDPIVSVEQSAASTGSKSDASTPEKS